MKKINPIRVKAVFLLIAFSLNSIIGFGCAIGLNMGFNSNCHDGEKSIKCECCHSVLKHNQAENIKKEHPQTGETDNCCHNKVVKIAQAEKFIPQSSGISVNSFLLYKSSSAFYNIDLFNSLKDTYFTHFARIDHPPIQDIRIAIKSFQI